VQPRNCALTRRPPARPPARAPVLSTLVSSSAGAAAPVFVVHGGLFHTPGVTLAQIAGVKRTRDIPYGFPGFEDKLFEDLMWSDPRASPNGTCASDRGAGVVFGPDVTERFCALNGVSLVVRSHECMHEGAAFTHDGRLVTVFSASLYCGKTSNKGAVLVFDAALKHAIVAWEAPPLADCAIDGDAPPGANAARAKVSPHLTSDAVNRMLIERIVLHKAVRPGVDLRERPRARR
jgi:protein phosphatase